MRSADLGKSMIGRGAESGMLVLLQCRAEGRLGLWVMKLCLHLCGVEEEAEGRVGVGVVRLSLAAGVGHWVGRLKGTRFGRLSGPLSPEICGDLTVLKHNLQIKSGMFC